MPGGGMSGITVADEVFTTYQELKQKRSFSYIIFKIVNKSLITVADKGCKGSTWDELIAKLSSTEPAYIIYDLCYKGKGGMDVDKPVLIVWNPDTASIQVKMLYASSKDALKKKLGDSGLGVDVQANDFGDLLLEDVKAKQLL